MDCAAEPSIFCTMPSAAVTAVERIAVSTVLGRRWSVAQSTCARMQRAGRDSVAMLAGREDCRAIRTFGNATGRAAGGASGVMSAQGVVSGADGGLGAVYAVRVAVNVAMNRAPWVSISRPGLSSSVLDKRCAQTPYRDRHCGLPCQCRHAECESQGRLGLVPRAEIPAPHDLAEGRILERSEQMTDDGQADKARLTVRDCGSDAVRGRRLLGCGAGMCVWAGADRDPKTLRANRGKAIYFDRATALPGTPPL
ncbi:hypothetical protein BU16DRAFT_554453 [Lophium mytilinum]|uniref:Uncharacterized protein n=1 Tax=Lophium mytilinum TaxID=390894 RepID=A0A6A6RDC0_9PEZI|nr:hypothetical protein BU16DRAFT_554453 [Lophium mytilinum]